MTAADLKVHMKKLNNSMAFLIKHSQKLFRVTVNHAHEKSFRIHFAVVESHRILFLLDNLWMN